MATPNIVQVSSLTGRTNAAIITTTVSTLLANPISSNKLVKVTSLRVTNADTTPSSVTFELYRLGNSYPLVLNHVLNASSPTVLVTKDSAIYLEEGDEIRCNSNANVGLAAICSFEVIA